jgi:hypothetical protein
VVIGSDVEVGAAAREEVLGDDDVLAEGGGLVPREPTPDVHATQQTKNATTELEALTMDVLRPGLEAMGRVRVRREAPDPLTVPVGSGLWGEEQDRVGSGLWGEEQDRVGGWGSGRAVMMN